MGCCSNFSTKDDNDKNDKLKGKKLTGSNSENQAIKDLFFSKNNKKEKGKNTSTLSKKNKSR